MVAWQYSVKYVWVHILYVRKREDDRSLSHGYILGNSLCAALSAYILSCIIVCFSVCVCASVRLLLCLNILGENAAKKNQITSTSSKQVKHSYKLASPKIDRPSYSSFSPSLSLCVMKKRSDENCLQNFLWLMAA